MGDDDIRDLVSRVLAEVLGADVDVSRGLAEDASLRDLGVSSLQLFEFVSLLEERGGFAFDDEDVDYEKFQTVRLVTELVAKYQPDASSR